MLPLAAVGECMIELSEHPDGRITRGYGGDTLNTATYLARLGITVDYVTGLGDDHWSDQMIAGWRSEGIGTDTVVRFTGRVPGLYVIQTDPAGERRFTYWRDRAPARDIFACADTGRVVERLAAAALIYVSGISLSLYGSEGRHELLGAIDRCRAAGGRLAFDTNFRPRGWPDLAEARTAFLAVIARADWLFAGVEDLTPIFGTQHSSVLDSAPATDLILKQIEPICTVRSAGTSCEVAAPSVDRVVDTTAAGDSFAAGYMAARLRGAAAAVAARAGHHLASTVVQHRGAVIPRAAMPKPLLPEPRS
jgi:2-dehydro-3-deoxygluconokinase